MTSLRIPALLRERGVESGFDTTPPYVIGLMLGIITVDDETFTRLTHQGETDDVDTFISAVERDYVTGTITEHNFMEVLPIVHEELSRLERFVDSFASEWLSR